MFVQIVDDVRAAFTAAGYTEVSVDEGIRARVTQENYGAGSANRVVFSPSPDPLEVIPPMRIGERHDPDDDENVSRQLFDVLFVFEVSFAGYNADYPDRDLMHRRRCFDLWEVTAQAIQASYPSSGDVAGGASHGWTSARWNLDRTDGVHGAELIATLILNIPLFDRDWAVVTPTGVPGQPKPPPPLPPPPPDEP
jgi:hypothetical protein